MITLPSAGGPMITWPARGHVLIHDNAAVSSDNMAGPWLYSSCVPLARDRGGGGAGRGVHRVGSVRRVVSLLADAGVMGA